MKQIWRTSDGKIFETIEPALEWEKRLEGIEKVTNYMLSNSPLPLTQTDTTTLVTWIFDNLNTIEDLIP